MYPELSAVLRWFVRYVVRYRLNVPDNKPMNKANQPLPFSDLIKSGEPVLVEFFATWCAPCKALAPTLKHLADRTGDKLKIVKVDIDRSRAAATKFQIQSVPTMILFKDGKVVWRQTGVQSIGKLEALVKPYL